MAVSTVKLNGTTLMTVNDTTAAASDVLTGEYFYAANGVRTVGTLMHDIDTYSDVTELNLTSGNTTIAGAWTALPNKSLLVADSSQWLSSTLPTYDSTTMTGTVEILKYNGTNGYGWIRFYGRNYDVDFCMYINSSNAPSGTWVQDVHSNMMPDVFSIKGVTCTGSSTSAGSTFNYSTGVTQVAGYYPYCIAGYSSSGMTYCNITNLYVDHSGTGSIKISGRNLGTSAVTPSFSVYVLYLKNS